MPEIVTVGWRLEARSSAFNMRKIEHGNVDGAPLLSGNPHVSWVMHCVLVSLGLFPLFSNRQGASLLAVLPSSSEREQLLTEPVPTEASLHLPSQSNSQLLYVP